MILSKDNNHYILWTNLKPCELVKSKSTSLMGHQRNYRFVTPCRPVMLLWICTTIHDVCCLIVLSKLHNSLIQWSWVYAIFTVRVSKRFP